jgi:ComF family protein
MIAFSEIRDSLLHLFFPHNCSGCGTDLLNEETCLCLRCFSQLPETNFHFHANNPVEKKFWGRLPLVSATAQYYFTKESLMQHLMHQFKYKGNKELGRQLGRLMGNELMATHRFSHIDALIPLPLFAAKEKRRGYNQSVILCEGISEIMNRPILNDVVVRTRQTETQTKKGRIERWVNMEGKFQLMQPGKIAGKHLLLIDDIITTGATLEACGLELLKVENVRLSIATFCCSSR